MSAAPPPAEPGDAPEPTAEPGAAAQPPAGPGDAPEPPAESGGAPEPPAESGGAPEPPAESGGAPEPPAESGGAPEPLRSGLRNPAAAVRGMGAATLALEALVLLLAIQPIRIASPDTPGWALGVVGLLALLCAVLAGMMRRPWAWTAGTVLQVAILLTGVLQWAMFVLGVVFLAIWLYELRVRRTILGSVEKR